jgi:hypothetical protein
MLRSFKRPEPQYPQNSKEFQEMIFKDQGIEYFADCILLLS